MAATLEKQLGLKSELLASHGGVFEITLDGKVVFSKKSLGRFPEEAEIVDLLRSEGE